MHFDFFLLPHPMSLLTETLMLLYTYSPEQTLKKSIEVMTSTFFPTSLSLSLNRDTNTQSGDIWLGGGVPNNKKSFGSQLHSSHSEKRMLKEN